MLFIRKGANLSSRASTISDAQLLKFPNNFLWGAATSAFQVEGHPSEISSRLSDWSAWTTLDSKIADQSTADKACDFYRLYAEDIALSRSLNCNAFRIGLNWPALCPKQSSPFALNQDTLSYYRKVLKALKSNGMTTFVTLFHFCLPNWLAEIGGWNNPLTVEEFAKFSHAVAEELGDLVDYWLTINEPLVYAYHGYIKGVWPPGHQKNYLWAFTAIRNMLEGHAACYQAIKSVIPEAPVSFTLHWRPFAARNKFNPLDQIVRYMRDQVFNHVFPLAVERGDLQFPFPLSAEPAIKKISGPIAGLKGTMDYMAINYFTREICEFKPCWPFDMFGIQSPVTRLETTPLGWEVYPEGLYYLLTEDIAPYRYDHQGNLRPIIITENGMATSFSADLTGNDWSLDDEQRVRFLYSHLAAIHQAISQGANVTGYLHWSLLDNFEWADGLNARFGLVRVSYPTQQRAPRRSAEVYAGIAADNAIDLQQLHELNRLKDKQANVIQADNADLCSSSNSLAGQ